MSQSVKGDFDMPIKGRQVAKPTGQVAKLNQSYIIVPRELWLIFSFTLKSKTKTKEQKTYQNSICLSMTVADSLLNLMAVSENWKNVIFNFFVLFTTGHVKPALCY